MFCQLCQASGKSLQSYYNWNLDLKSMTLNHLVSSMDYSYSCRLPDLNSFRTMLAQPPEQARWLHWQAGDTAPSLQRHSVWSCLHLIIRDIRNDVVVFPRQQNNPGKENPCSPDICIPSTKLFWGIDSWERSVTE